ncbi:MAG: rod shape-determining protein MreC [Elusimicrobiota bacterium]
MKIKKNPIVLLSLYLIVSIIILSFNLNPTVKMMRNFLFYIVVTPYSKVNYVVSSVGNLGGNIKEIVNSHQEVLELKNQNQNLLHDLVKLKTLEIENKRLTELLGYKRNIKRNTVIARIIAKPPQQYYKSLIIDKGSDDGLSDNRAVFGFYKGKFGVVGQLTNVEKNVSIVLTITNRISKVPARIVPAAVDGIVMGRESNELDMIWIPADAEIKIGDEVVTSSASDIFPAGIPIGIIVSITQTGHLPFKKASIKPHIPAFQLTDVFIE